MTIMNAFSSQAIKAYASVGVETGVIDASPHQLILMLYDGAIASVTTAQLQLQLKNVEARGHAASKAIAIIRDGLAASLQQSVGGEVAKNLSDLYQYMVHRLFQANLNSDGDGLEEVRLLLIQLKSAWQNMESSNPDWLDSAVHPTIATPPHRAAHFYGSV